MKKLAVPTLIVLLVLAGFIYFFLNKASKSTGQVAESTAILENAQNTSEQGVMVNGYNGAVLAGTKTPFIIFNTKDYEKALQNNKVVILDFYADWCPICRAEAPDLYAGFNALNNDNVIGFRVNYNDADTDNDEKELARKYKVTYQHTKVILKDGQEFSKTLEIWDKNKFLLEVNKAL